MNTYDALRSLSTRGTSRAGLGSLLFAALLLGSAGCGGDDSGQADSREKRTVGGTAEGTVEAPKEGAALAESGARAAETRTYTNGREALIPKLAENFVPFSFEYPATWKVLERGDQPDDVNFVKVERGTPDGFTSENFAVGYVSLPPGTERNPAVLKQLLDTFEAQFSTGFPNYRRVSDDRTTVGGREATGFRFAAHAENTPRGPVDLWGRILVLPGDDGRGVVLMMIGSPVESVLRGPEDVGEKGDLPTILRSFRMGR
ncbi:MAG TPA: hypothetical protein VF746_13920 [Longimicrobium sp.]|jgi:hypothetical protein